jgi:hypothetical protein
VEVESRRAVASLNLFYIIRGLNEVLTINKERTVTRREELSLRLQGVLAETQVFVARLASQIEKNQHRSESIQSSSRPLSEEDVKKYVTEVVYIQEVIQEQEQRLLRMLGDPPETFVKGDKVVLKDPGHNVDQETGLPMVGLVREVRTDGQIHVDFKYGIHKHVYDPSELEKTDRTVTE